jgi:UDP-2-acetamido-3-amino-2,3-dideoxy-glucuronate N-acetyltransferase
MTPQIHALADIQSPHIGPSTRIWQFVVILPNARIGADCNISSHVLIENDVIIGDRVTVKSGVQVWDGLRLEDDVFVGPNVTFTNDRYPRSKHYPDSFPVTTVQRGASIGGGGSDSAGHHDRRAGPGRRRSGGDEVGARRRGSGGQPGAHCALPAARRHRSAR